MTRLTEALERAQAAQGTQPAIPAVTDSPEAVRDVPAEWHFQEAGDESAPTAQAALTQATLAPEEPLASFKLDSARSVGPTPVASQPILPVSVKDAVDRRPEVAATTKEQLKQKLVSGQRDNLLIEQFRRLAAVLHHAQLQRQARTVMIASAVPAEGKSLTAANLALTLSQSYEKRVLLIDADLRRPSLHTLLNVPNESGLTSSLNHPGEHRLPVVAVHQNLWLLPAGRPDPNPTSLVTSAAMRQLLTEAAAQFDWVIIDTPPVGLMPDANLLASMVDAAFVVVHSGRTPYPLVKKAIDAIGLERVLGVVLNQAERAAAAAAYSYSYYDYYAEDTRGAGNRKRFALG